MSRVGKYPVKLPQGVTVTIADGKATVKGKLGELSCDLSDLVKVTVQEGEVVVEPVSKTKEGRMIWGTTRANLNNMVKGVTEGFVRKLELIGVGYKAQAVANGVFAVGTQTSRLPLQASRFSTFSGLNCIYLQILNISQAKPRSLRYDV